MKWKASEKIRFQTPVPTRVISNGEYDPMEQTANQKKTEVEINNLLGQVASEKGISRRELLGSTAAIAIGLLAMNKVFGPFFNVSLSEILSPPDADQFKKKISEQFIFDVQTHMVKDDFHHPSLLRFAKWASDLNVQASLKDKSADMNMFKFPNFLKEVFVDSDTDLAILSGAPFSNGDPLPNDLLFDVVDAVNEVAQATILFGNYVINPMIDGWLERCKKEAHIFKPLSWKLFPVGDPLSPTGQPWRLDDKKLIYPFYDFAMKSGIRTICVHKGLTPKHYEKRFPAYWEAANVNDLAQAAKDWPEINFVIFHSALRPFASESTDEELRQFYKHGYIRWTSDLVRINQELGAKNIFAEIGTSFASSCISNPEFCAAFMGTLINGMGPEKVLWGTDAVWYGSPQWQIEAFRRLEIPEAMSHSRNWTHHLGEAHSSIRQMILGHNSANVFKIDRTLIGKKAPFRSEWIEKAKSMLSERSNRYYGYHR